MKTYLKGMNKRWKKRMFKAWYWGCFLHSPSSCQFSLKLDKTLSVERMATETPHWPLAAPSPAPATKEASELQQNAPGFNSKRCVLQGVRLQPRAPGAPGVEASPPEAESAVLAPRLAPAPQSEGLKCGRPKGSLFLLNCPHAP